MNRRGQWGEIAALGTAQTLAWASSYYLPAILAQPIAAELGLPAYGLFAAFSMALLVSAAVGPFAGKLIDRRGGRPVLLASNLIFACGLTLLSQSHGVAGLALAWMVIGVAMGSGLYEAAFSTLVKLHGKDSRNAITGITLIAGFASTVGWPLTMYLESSFGWRDTCLIWAALHVLLGLPLNARLRPMSRETARPIAPPGSAGAPASGNRRSQFLLAYVFAVSWFISTAMAAHMPGLLAQNGVPLLTAVFIAGLVGPSAQ